MDQNASMTEVIPNLWVGNLRARANIKLLTTRRFSCIINCCSADLLDRYSMPPLPHTIHQVNLNIIERGPDDSNSMESMLAAIPLAVGVIEKYLNSGMGPVLVHCYAGRQRSPSIIISYLVEKCGYSVDSAYDIVSGLWVYTGNDYLDTIREWSRSTPLPLP